MTKKESAIQSIKFKIKRQSDKALAKLENISSRYIVLNILISSKKGVEEYPIHIPIKIFKNKKFLNKHVLDYHFEAVAEKMIENKMFIKKVFADTRFESLVEDK